MGNRKSFLGGALLYLTFFLSTAGDDGLSFAQDSDGGEFKKLIEQLKAEAVEARDDAESKLLAMGRSILKRLSDELERTRDNEARSRLQNLIQQLSPVRLEPILARVRAIAANDDWKKKDWSDPELDSLLTRFVGRVRKVTDIKHLRLPIGFDEVHAVQDGTPPFYSSMGEGRRLLVIRGGRVIGMKRGILLVDGSIEVHNAEDSIIIATMSVNVSSGNRNVVMAGQYVGASSDGSDDYSKHLSGSLLVSGAVLNVSHSYGSVCAAPDLIQASSARGAVLLNAKEKPESRKGRESFRDVQTDELILAFGGGDNPLKDKLVITGVAIYGKRNEKILFELPDGTGPYVGRLNAPLTRPDGMEIESLKGWRLRTALSSSYFLFEKEKQVAAFIKKDREFVPLPLASPRKE